MQSMLRVVIDPFYTTVVVLGTVNLLMVAEIMRSAMTDFPQQYLQAARVCGLSTRAAVRYIQLPIIFRQTCPSILLVQVAMLHATLFASLISVDEVFRVAQRINSIEYRPVEVYSALGLLFLAVCVPLNLTAFYLRKRFSRNISER